MEPRKHRLTVLLVSLLLAGLAAELLLRATEDGRPWKRRLVEDGTLIKASGWIYDPRTSARFRPGWTGRYYYSGAAEHSSVRINSWGFRSPEVAEENPDGTLRVALLGDSLTAALQVEDDEHFRALLPRKLDFPSPVEVMNFGVPGTGPVSHLNVYRHHARRFAPDLVVLGIYTDNDFSDDRGVRWRHDDGSLVDEPFVDAPGDLGKFLKANSCLVLAVWAATRKRALEAREEASEVEPATAAAPRELASHELAGVSREVFEEKLRIWQALFDLTRADRATTIVVLFPDGTGGTGSDWKPRPDRTELHRRLAARFAGDGIEVAGSEELLARHARRAGGALHHDWRPWAKRGNYLSEAAHRTLAELLVEKIIPPPRPRPPEPPVPPPRRDGGSAPPPPA